MRVAILSFVFVFLGSCLCFWVRVCVFGFVSDSNCLSFSGKVVLSCTKLQNQFFPIVDSSCYS